MTALALIGRGVDSNWEHWGHNLGYFDCLAVVAILAWIVYLVVERRRRTRGASGAAALEAE